MESCLCEQNRHYTHNYNSLKCSDQNCKPLGNRKKFLTDNGMETQCISEIDRNLLKTDKNCFKNSTDNCERTKSNCDTTFNEIHLKNKNSSSTVQFYSTNFSKPLFQNAEMERRNYCSTYKTFKNPWRISFINVLVLGNLLLLSMLGSSGGFSDSFFDDEFDDETSPLRVYARSRRSAEAFSSIKDAESLIPSNYSIHEPPPTNNSEATGVDFSVLIMNVRDIKELNEGYGDLDFQSFGKSSVSFAEELSLEMNLRIYWKDTRLAHLADRSGNKFIVLNPKLIEKIWMPDIFIDHVKAVAQPALITKPASLRVYPDSSVRYSARITVTMACQMDFHYYPADTQRCNVDMKSYAYSSKILALDWREGKGALLVDYLELPNFDVALDTTQNFMVNTSSGSYSGIRFTILLRRKLSYHLIQTYLPSTLFIIVSWLSFLVPPESVPGRMALCMTTLLTLTAMFSAVRQNTPNVSYVKALDIWMVVCIIFVFLTLVEYTVLLKLRSKKPKPGLKQVISGATQNGGPNMPMISYRSYGEFPTLQNLHGTKLQQQPTTDTALNNGATGDVRRRQPDAANPTEPTMPVLPPPPAPPPPPPTAIPLQSQEKVLNKYELAAKKIEKFTSCVIPTLFVVFNFIYWPWLIESANYYDHHKSSTVYHAL